MPQEGGLPGRITLDAKWYIGSELVAYGRKLADYDPPAFQGIYTRSVLVIIDEAGSVPKLIFDAVDALAHLITLDPGDQRGPDRRRRTGQHGISRGDVALMGTIGGLGVGVLYTLLLVRHQISGAVWWGGGEPACLGARLVCDLVCDTEEHR
jgi:hypothetical protein